ncbi:MAG: AI-2E family transporter, partial [Comamonadaceae bacterium]
LVDSLPVAARKVRDAVRERVSGPSPLDTVQRAASQIEQAAAGTAPPQTQRGVQRVVIERPPFNIRDYVWSGTMGLASAVGQMTVVIFLTFFSLASGNLFKRKMMRIAGSSLERRRITAEVLEDITKQIQRYLLVQVFTSVLVGFATWAAYAALGLENPAVWGVVAASLNLAPYIGSLVVTGTSALVAFLQFGTLDMALAIGGASLIIHTIIGNLITPWLTSRTSAMSPVAVFVSVLAWGWLWGLWGLLLGIPVMMIVKAICDRVDDLRPVGELLGD